MAEKKVVEFTIPCIDGDGEPATGRIEIGQGVGIYIDGYGLREMEPGHGDVIYLEKYNGKANVTIWPDIREGDGQTIDLEPAREERRIDE